MLKCVWRLPMQSAFKFPNYNTNWTLFRLLTLLANNLSYDFYRLVVLIAKCTKKKKGPPNMSRLINKTHAYPHHRFSRPGIFFRAAQQPSINTRKGFIFFLGCETSVRSLLYTILFSAVDGDLCPDVNKRVGGIYTLVTL